MTEGGTGTPPAETKDGTLTPQHTQHNQHTQHIVHQNIRLLPADAYLSEPVPDRPKFLVDGLIPREGRIMLNAAPKQGKSTLAVQLAAALCSGAPFLGRDVTPGRTLYFQFDAPEQSWRDLLERGQIDESLSYTDLYIIHPTDLPRNIGQYDIRLAEWQRWTHDLIKQVNPHLIIFDVFRKLHRGRENDSGDMTDVHNALTAVTRGRAVLILHHTPKFHETPDSPIPDPSMSGRGSGIIAGDADGTWLLHRSTLHIVSRYDEDLSFTMRRTPSGFWITRAEHDHKLDMNFTLFLQAHEGKSHREMARLAAGALGMSRATFFRHLHRYKRTETT